MAGNPDLLPLDWVRIRLISRCGLGEEIKIAVEQGWRGGEVVRWR